MQTTSLDTMLETAKKVMQHSYSPYSHYSVGACLKSENNHIFSGTNVENASYGLTTCAESAAISVMISAGFYTIEEIIIIGRHADKSDDLCTPCGACRQRIYEFSTSQTRIHLANEHGIQKTLTIEELLPHAFGPKHLK